MPIIALNQSLNEPLTHCTRITGSPDQSIGNWLVRCESFTINEVFILVLALRVQALQQIAVRRFAFMRHGGSESARKEVIWESPRFL